MSNLAVRTISGIAFVLVMLGGLLVNRYLFAALLIFMMVTMMLEFFRMAMGKRHIAAQIIAIAIGVSEFSLLFAYYNWGIHIRFVVLPVSLLMALLISAIFSKDRQHIEDYAYVLGGLLYIGVPLTLSNTVAFRGTEFNTALLLCFFILIWCSDIGAYGLGLALGKGSKKMAPDISPKKTWVGFFGGLLFSSIAAIVLMLTGIFSFPWYHCIVLAMLIHASGVCGDLFESLWKRHFGVKDSGTLIPGHGGMLDRFDSTLIAMPIGAIYLSMVGLL